MKEIIQDLKNPFDINSFVNLLNLLSKSNDARGFYSKIVTYFQDRSMDGDGHKGIKDIPDSFITTDYMGHWNYAEYYSKYFATQHRIYINSSLETTAPLVELFINECINSDIPFELKYAKERNSRSDGIVIGSTTNAYKKHIDILRKIAEKHPEFIDECGTPHLLTSPLDGWMGLADENVSNRGLSYAESRVGIIISSCMKFLANHPELKDEIDGYEKAMEYYNNSRKYVTEDVIDDIETGDINESQKDSEINRRWNEEISNMLNEFGYQFSYADFGRVLSRMQEKDPNTIQELYDYFLDTCQILDVNPQMPTQYTTSEMELLKVQENEPTLNENEFEDKSYISILNEYFSNPDQKLTIQDKVILLKTIDEKMMNQLSQFNGSIKMYYNLTGNDKNTMVDWLRGNDVLKRFDHKKFKDYDEPLYEKDNEELKKIKERISSFLANFLEPRQEYERSLMLLKNMLNTLKKENKSGLWNAPDLNRKISLIEDIVKNYDKIKEELSRISSELDSLAVENVSIPKPKSNDRPSMTTAELYGADLAFLFETERPSELPYSDERIADGIRSNNFEQELLSREDNSQIKE